MKYVNCIITFFFLLVVFSGSFLSFLGTGCARGPFPTPVVETPTQAGTPSATALSQNVLDITVTLAGNVDKYHGYYVYAFNRPAINETEADPISTNIDFWTDYISLGPIPPQISDFIRRERITAGDINSVWNPTTFTFTAGTISGQKVEVIIPLQTVGNPKDVYFNFVTTDTDGVPRDAFGFGTGSATDSYRINLNNYFKVQTVPDINGDVVLSPSPPANFNPPSYDIISSDIIVTSVTQ